MFIYSRVKNIIINALVDTGATGHYLDENTEKICENIEPTSTGPIISVANGDVMNATKRATMPLAPQLSAQAKEAHVFKDLSSGPLVSIGRLCDDDCVALFSKTNYMLLIITK